MALWILLGLVALSASARAAEPNHALAPGVAVAYSPPSSGEYIGSPSLAVLPDGRYVASHDFFWLNGGNNRTHVYRSEDKGATWKRVAQIEGMCGGTLFVHKEALYILGTVTEYGSMVIRRSSDGGATWTEPKDGRTGLIARGHYCTAPVPLLTHKGRLWRAAEVRSKFTPGKLGYEYCQARVLSASVDADLLTSGSWTLSAPLAFDQNWLGAAWIEGNVVAARDGELLDILRVQGTEDEVEKAAVVHVSDDGTSLSFQPDRDFIDFPGGRAKFTIRYDEASERYWSLVNKMNNPVAYRNVLALTTSQNLREWTSRGHLLENADRQNVAFQYVDWLIEGDDILAVSRTAFNGASNAHDANYLTFHRFKDLRNFNLPADAGTTATVEQMQAAQDQTSSTVPPVAKAKPEPLRLPQLLSVPEKLDVPKPSTSPPAQEPKDAPPAEERAEEAPPIEETEDAKQQENPTTRALETQPIAPIATETTRSEPARPVALPYPPGFGADFERVKFNNPGLTVDLAVGLWAWPMPMDWDGDGDFDLLVSCTDVSSQGTWFFENASGNVKMPAFKPAVRVGPGHANVQISYVEGSAHALIPAHELIDLNETRFEKTLRIYPSDTVHATQSRIRANQWKYCDYDGDGALDLVVGVGDWGDYGWDEGFDADGRWKRGPGHGFVYLVRNTATTTSPTYASPVKIEADGAPVDVYGMPSPNFADFDGDGDLDLICGEFMDRLTCFRNAGTRAEPAYERGRFLTHNDRIIALDGCMIVPVAIDWDMDGDPDLIVGAEDGTVSLIENTGEMRDGLPHFLPPVRFQQEADDLQFGVLATPVSFDWDGDGDEDLVCGNASGYVGFIENLDGENPPKWARPRLLEAGGLTLRILAGYNGSIQGPCEAKWGYTTLSVADWDQDGLPDLVVNSIWGAVVWYRNVGTRPAPQLAEAEPIRVEWPEAPPKPAWTWWEPKGNQLATQWRTTPVVIDLNRDGLSDLVMLDHEGYLAFFERVKKEGRLALLPGKRVFQTPGGALRLNSGERGRSGRRKLCFADWNGDGRLDLLVDGANINLLHNISTATPTTQTAATSESLDGQFVFADVGPLGKRRLAGHTTSPALVDWNRDGVEDLLAGAEDGRFYFLRNPGAYPYAETVPERDRQEPGKHPVAEGDSEETSGGVVADKAPQGATSATLELLGSARIESGPARIPADQEK